MPGIALSNGKSSISATDGAKGSGCAFNRGNAYAWHWNTPTTQTTDAGSSDVFIENIGAVRDGDAMVSHPDGNPCVSTPTNHAPTLSTFSSTVFINNKGVGRIGDKFNSDGHYDHEITSGATTVFVD